MKDCKEQYNLYLDQLVLDIMEMILYLQSLRINQKVDILYASCYSDGIAKENVEFQMKQTEIKHLMYCTYWKIKEFRGQVSSMKSYRSFLSLSLPLSWEVIGWGLTKPCDLPIDNGFRVERIVGYKASNQTKYHTMEHCKERLWTKTNAYDAMDKSRNVPIKITEDLRKSALYHAELVHKVNRMMKETDSCYEVNIKYQTYTEFGYKGDVKTYTLPSSLLKNLLSDTITKLNHIKIFNDFTVYHDLILSCIRYQWDSSKELRDLKKYFASDLSFEIPENGYFTFENILIEDN